MTETLSHTFITALEASRDQLYTLALAKSPTAPEPELHRAARALFAQLAARRNGTDITSAMTAALSGSPAPSDNLQPMPADVWARLAALIQVEAAQSDHTEALHPDSGLLSPDPLLAPRKKRFEPDDDSPIRWSPLRMALTLLIVLVLAIATTAYIVMRPSASTHPSTHPATTRGALP